MSASPLPQVVDHLWSARTGVRGSTVLAVLDGARDPRIEETLRERSASHACLYSGRLTARLRAAAPYVARLVNGSASTREILDILWGRSAGFLAVAAPGVSFDDVRRHLKNLLRVKDESGRFLVFRYYDPRVLRTYLPTCTADEAERFFGPFLRIVIEGDDDGTALSAAPTPQGVRLAKVGAAGDAAPPGADGAGAHRNWVGATAGSLVVVRDAQRAALARIPLARFERDLVRHFFRHYPRECALLGRERVLAWVRLGVAQASSRGFRSQREAALYLGLMMILGCRFDRDPQYAWAAEAADPAPGDEPWDRLRRVYDAAVAFLDDTVGQDNRILVRALLRMRKYDPTAAADESAGAMEPFVAGVLDRLYPEKWARHSEAERAALVAAGIERARGHGIEDAAGTVTFVALRFVLGCAFDEDPLHPWASRVLSDPAHGTGAERGRALHRAALDHLSESLVDG